MNSAISPSKWRWEARDERWSTAIPLDVILQPTADSPLCAMQMQARGHTHSDLRPDFLTHFGLTSLIGCALQLHRQKFNPIKITIKVIVGLFIICNDFLFMYIMGSFTTNNKFLF